MLERLDEIKWKDVTHAYGSAADVPDQIRRLLTDAGDPWADESPIRQLFSNIWHQGTVYPASARAIPFLFEVVMDPRTPNRSEILMLIASIAEGSSYLDAHAEMPGVHGTKAQLAEELGWVRSAHLAVAKGLPLLKELLADSVAEIRLGAAHVLACLRSHFKEVEPLLLGMLTTESAGLHRAGVLLLLGKLGSGSKFAVAEYRKSLGHDDPEKTAAAIAIVMASRKKMRKRVEPILQAAADDPEAFEELFRGLPWDVHANLEIDDYMDMMENY